MSTRLHRVKNIEYDDKTLEYCTAYDNPIADNLSSYLSEANQYYLDDDTFEEYKESVLKDINNLKDENLKKEQLEILDRMEKITKKDSEIIIEAW